MTSNYKIQKITENEAAILQLRIHLCRLAKAFVSLYSFHWIQIFSIRKVCTENLIRNADTFDIQNVFLSPLINGCKFCPLPYCLWYIAGILVIVGAVVFVINNTVQTYLEEHAFRGQVHMKPHTGFALCVTSGILCLVAALLYHLDFFFRKNTVVTV